MLRHWAPDAPAPTWPCPYPLLGGPKWAAACGRARAGRRARLTRALSARGRTSTRRALMRGDETWDVGKRMVGGGRGEGGGTPDEARPGDEDRGCGGRGRIGARQGEAALAAWGGSMGGEPPVISFGQAEIMRIRQCRFQRALRGGQGRSQPAQEDRIGEQDHAEGHDAPLQP